MADRGQRPLGRLAFLLVLVVLAMTSALAAYVMFVKLRELPIVAPPPGSSGLDPTQKLAVVMMTVLATVLAILAFVVGAYLFIRIGRSLTERRVSDGPTEFVDAWSNYRVSQDELDAVDDCADAGDGRDNSTPPGDNFDDNDQDDHDSQDER